jgi:hypothetical protein
LSLVQDHICFPLPPPHCCTLMTVTQIIFAENWQVHCLQISKNWSWHPSQHLVISSFHGTSHVQSGVGNARILHFVEVMVIEQQWVTQLLRVIPNGKQTE